MASNLTFRNSREFEDHHRLPLSNEILIRPLECSVSSLSIRLKISRQFCLDSSLIKLAQMMNNPNVTKLAAATLAPLNASRTFGCADHGQAVWARRGRERDLRAAYPRTVAG
jgi:hypothetical protein